MLPDYLSIERIKEFEVIFKGIPDRVSYESGKFYAGIKFVSNLPKSELEKLVAQYEEISFCISETSGVSSLVHDGEFYFLFIFECESESVDFVLKDRDNLIHLPGPFRISKGNYHIIGLVIPYILDEETIVVNLVKEEVRCYVVIEKLFDPVFEVIDAP